MASRVAVPAAVGPLPFDEVVARAARRARSSAMPERTRRPRARSPPCEAWTRGRPSTALIDERWRSLVSQSRTRFAARGDSLVRRSPRAPTELQRAASGRRPISCRGGRWRRPGRAGVLGRAGRPSPARRRSRRAGRGGRGARIGRLVGARVSHCTAGSRAWSDHSRGCIRRLRARGLERGPRRALPPRPRRDHLTAGRGAARRGARRRGLLGPRRGDRPRLRRGPRGRTGRLGRGGRLLGGDALARRLAASVGLVPAGRRGGAAVRGRILRRGRGELPHAARGGPARRDRRARARRAAREAGSRSSPGTPSPRPSREFALRGDRRVGRDAAARAPARPAVLPVRRLRRVHRAAARRRPVRRLGRRASPSPTASTTSTPSGPTSSEARSAPAC